MLKQIKRLNILIFKLEHLHKTLLGKNLRNIKEKLKLTIVEQFRKEFSKQLRKKNPENRSKFPKNN